MQTFLSEDTFEDSAAVLDTKRLNKQYLEGWQILNAIAQTPDGGGSRVNGKVPFASNHPATNMWRGHEHLLYQYLECVRIELNRRDVKTDTTRQKLADTLADNMHWVLNDKRIMPVWWRNQTPRFKILITHRANLYNKYPEFYAQYESSARLLDADYERLVCCPSKHAPYYYPTHTKEYN